MKLKYSLIISSLLLVGCSKSGVQNYSYNEYYSPNGISGLNTNSFASKGEVITYDYSGSNIPEEATKRKKNILFNKPNNKKVNKSMFFSKPKIVQKTYEQPIYEQQIIHEEPNKKVLFNKLNNTVETYEQPKEVNPFNSLQPKLNPKTNLKSKAPHQFNIHSRQNNKSIQMNRYTKKDKILDKAKSMIGVPYKWGANGPYAYDCSSFVKKVYLDSTGIDLPRVSRDQAKMGKYIYRGGLTPGDLVFFRDKKNYDVRHVGIYLGNGKFIHDSSTTMQVKINSLNEPYYSKHFKHGRRLI